ncbi:DUF6929 family protein [Neorhizobium galegae]|uniref:DUF6929 family protein n=1 Tax=Neorhizobium galegae TaxID=399 RepID=UPI0021030BD8|nr:hypothetical protein [Neorhizobium galegae]MCQ1837125.1 hypothetical protein [Neorhizobium galegae]
MINATEIRALDVSPEVPTTQRLYISAASGLVCVCSTMYVVADDELHLGVFSKDTSEPGHLIRLFAGDLPSGKAERKQQKPDLEAITFVPAFDNFPHGALLAMGSASRPNRGRGALLTLDAHGAVCGSPNELDMSPIVGPLHQVFDELNIEGAVVVRNELRLFQRGNKQHADNAIIRYSLRQVLGALQSSQADTVAPFAIERLDLGLIEGVPLCFTDATVLPGGEMVFCAVAEDTDDAYRDGRCVGAAIGIADNDGHLVSLHPLDRPYKVEGISARLENDTLELLLVTDADDPSIPARLLSASVAI